MVLKKYLIDKLDSQYKVISIDLDFKKECFKSDMEFFLECFKESQGVYYDNLDFFGQYVSVLKVWILLKSKLRNVYVDYLRDYVVFV